LSAGSVRSKCEHLFVNPRQQGDVGELSALQWLVSQGMAVALPFGHSPDWDLVAECEGRFLRVQVKTCTYSRDGRWCVAICTRGGNQSWSGLTKRFDPARCDYLFVHVGDGRRWFIPAARVAAGNGILLGGPKYSDYEVEPGPPLRKLTRADLAA
jgi:hypothetical protein